MKKCIKVLIIFISGVSAGAIILPRVLDFISSTLTPGALSININPSGVTSSTASSVTIRFYALKSGERKCTCRQKFRFTFRIGMLHGDNNFLALATRSIAPPIPFTILPGIFQLAISPFSETSIAPSTVRSTLPARIIPKLSALSKKPHR